MSLKNFKLILFVLSALALTATECQVSHGEEVQTHLEFKYLVSIKTYRQSNCKKRFRHGGVVISEKWVLTDAHSVDTENIDGRMCQVGRIEIVAGSKNWNANDKTVGAQVVSVGPEAVIVHPKYIEGDKTYDVALIYLGKKSFQKSYAVEWAPLAHKDYKIKNNDITIVGWGATEKEKFPVWPHRGQLKLVARKTCECGDFDGDHNLCYGCGSRGCLTGPGDSGSPVVHYAKTGPFVRPHVIGIHKGKRLGTWGIAVDVRKIRVWIRDEQRAKEARQASFFHFEKMAGAFSAAASAFGFC